MKQRIAEAIVMRGSKRLIDKDKADHLWNSRGARPPKAIPRTQRPAVELTELPTADQLRSVVAHLPEDAIPGLDVSRERKEHYQAELARVNAMKERGELVVADEVKKAAFSLGRTLRDQMMGIPERVAGQLAATTDVREVFRLLDDEIRMALRCLVDG